MNTALWIAQGLLAFLFLGAGAMKVFAFDRFAETMDWARPMGRPQVTAIGVAEIAGALGMVLPMLLGISEGLTPLAAVGLVSLMVMATGFHIQRGEKTDAARNAVILALALFVVWGRWDLLAS